MTDDSLCDTRADKQEDLAIKGDREFEGSNDLDKLVHRYDYNDLDILGAVQRSYSICSDTFPDRLGLCYILQDSSLVLVLVTWQHNGGRQKQIQVCKCRFHVYSESEVDNLGSHPFGTAGRCQ